MSAYIVAAVGTGVGKTFTTCALLHAARQRGMAARGYKPVISGWDASATSDTAQIIAAGGGTQTVEEVSPWRFTAPLSPHRAAALEGRSIAPAELVTWTASRVAADGLVLVEAVGGVMVPLGDGCTTLDWMAALRLPLILVTGSYLGSISHTLTALEVVKQAGIPLAALVVNESGEGELPLAEAKAGLAPFLGSIALQIFQPRVSSYQDAGAIAALLDHL